VPTTNNKATVDSQSIKVDHSFSDRDKITGRYFFNGGPTRYTSSWADPGADTRNGSDNRQQYVYGSYTRTASATLVNDLRFTYIRRSFHNLSAGLEGCTGGCGLVGVDGDDGIGTGAEDSLNDW